MKTLIILRHAKYSWKSAHLSDKERPLKSRGITDAGLVAERLKQMDIMPDIILTSSAKRAHSTATLVANGIGFPPNKITTENLIYGATEYDMLRLISNVPSSINTLVVVGHNPTFTGLVNLLGHGGLNNLPTCGCVGFGCNANTWANFGKEKREELFFIRPKNLRESLG